MGIHYCDFLWGILMGKSYWDILWGFLMGISNRLGWEDWARKAGLGRPGQGWPEMSWAFKVQLNIPITFPHNKSP